MPTLISTPGSFKAMTNLTFFLSFEIARPLVEYVKYFYNKFILHYLPDGYEIT